jgi:hypothetical protein
VAKAELQFWTDMTGMAGNKRKQLEVYKTPCFKVEATYADEHCDHATTISLQSDDFDLVGMFVCLFVLDKG